MMDLFPDLRSAHMPAPPAQPDSQQQQDTASEPQPRDDILAGNLDQLKQHLQVARVCHAQKAAAVQPDGHSKQASASQTGQALAQAQTQTTVAVPTVAQAARQQRKPQPPPPYATGQRSRQQLGSDRSGSDRWLNDAQPPLHRSISPPVPLTRAAPPLLHQPCPPPAFLQPNSRDGSSQSQSSQHALQQQALRRGQHTQQQRGGAMPRQHPPPARSSSADNLSRHAIVPDGKAAGPFGSDAAGQFAQAAAVHSVQQADGQVGKHLQTLRAERLHTFTQSMQFADEDQQPCDGMHELFLCLCRTLQFIDDSQSHASLFMRVQ